MTRFLSGISLCLMSFLAHAVEPVVTAPATTADPTAMIIFIIIFVGTIGGFFYFVWHNERKRKKKDGTADQ